MSIRDLKSKLTSVKQKGDGNPGLPVTLFRVGVNSRWGACAPLYRLIRSQASRT